MFCSPLSTFENCNLPIIIPLGMTTEDVDLITQPAFINLTDHDVFKIHEILDRPMFKLPKPGSFTTDFEKIMRLKLFNIAADLAWLKKNQKKLEIESLKVSGQEVADYITYKLNKLFQ